MRFIFTYSLFIALGLSLVLITPDILNLRLDYRLFDAFEYIYPTIIFGVLDYKYLIKLKKHFSVKQLLKTNILVAGTSSLLFAILLVMTAYTLIPLPGTSPVMIVGLLLGSTFLGTWLWMLVDCCIALILFRMYVKYKAKRHKIKG